MCYRSKENELSFEEVMKDFFEALKIASKYDTVDKECQCPLCRSEKRQRALEAKSKDISKRVKDIFPPIEEVRPKRGKEDLRNEISVNMGVIDKNQSKILFVSKDLYKELVHHNLVEWFKILIKRCALVFDMEYKTHIFDHPCLWYINWETGQPEEYDKVQHLSVKQLRQFAFFRSKAEAIASLMFFKDLRDKIYKPEKQRKK